jgi:hypothetical protein
MQLYHYFVSQSSEFCRHNPLCCFSTSVYCCKRIFRYRISPETFGYTLVKYDCQKIYLLDNDKDHCWPRQRGHHMNTNTGMARPYTNTNMVMCPTRDRTTWLTDWLTDRPTDWPTDRPSVAKWPKLGLGSSEIWRTLQTHWPQVPVIHMNWFLTCDLLKEYDNFWYVFYRLHKTKLISSCY